MQKRRQLKTCLRINAVIDQEEENKIHLKTEEGIGNNLKRINVGLEDLKLGSNNYLNKTRYNSWVPSQGKKRGSGWTGTGDRASRSSFYIGCLSS